LPNVHKSPSLTWFPRSRRESSRRCTHMQGPQTPAPSQHVGGGRPASPRGDKPRATFPLLDSVSPFTRIKAPPAACGETLRKPTPDPFDSEDETDDGVEEQTEGPGDEEFSLPPGWTSLRLSNGKAYTWSNGVRSTGSIVNAWELHNSGESRGGREGRRAAAEDEPASKRGGAAAPSSSRDEAREDEDEDEDDDGMLSVAALLDLLQTNDDDEALMDGARTRAHAPRAARPRTRPAPSSASLPPMPPPCHRLALSQLAHDTLPRTPLTSRRTHPPPLLRRRVRRGAGRARSRSRRSRSCSLRRLPLSSSPPPPHKPARPTHPPMPTPSSISPPSNRVTSRRSETRRRRWRAAACPRASSGCPSRPRCPPSYRLHRRTAPLPPRRPTVRSVAPPTSLPISFLPQRRSQHRSVGRGTRRTASSPSTSPSPPPNSSSPNS
jgi:hypothetical protein